MNASSRRALPKTLRASLPVLSSVSKCNKHSSRLLARSNRTGPRRIAQRGLSRQTEGHTFDSPRLNSTRQGCCVVGLNRFAVVVRGRFHRSAFGNLPAVTFSSIFSLTHSLSAVIASVNQIHSRRHLWEFYVIE